MELEYTVEIFREGEAYVSRCPEFEVASQGDTSEEAERMLQEAVTLFLESVKRRGYLERILENQT